MKVIPSPPTAYGVGLIIKICVCLFVGVSLFPVSLPAQQCTATTGAPACVGPPDAGSTSASFLPSPYVANPVDVISGNKYQHSDDYLAFGSRLQFGRHYNSVDSELQESLGAGWRHTYDVTLKRASDSRLLIKQSDGRVLEFLADNQTPDTYRAPHVADGYVETKKLSQWYLSDGRVLSFKGSYLVEVNYPDENTLTLSYANTRLRSVTDQFNRSIKLEYYPGNTTLASYDEPVDGSSPGKLQYLELPDSSRVHYQYDKSRNLKSVSYPEGTQSLYQYSDPDFSHHMTSAYEALEPIQKHWQYDQYGRAIQHINDSAELTVDVAFAPSDDTQLQQQTRVTTNDGWQADYQWQHSKELNLAHVTQYKEKSCLSCEPKSNQFDDSDLLAWQPPLPPADPATEKEREPTYRFSATKGALGGVVTVQHAAVRKSVTGKSKKPKLKTLQITVDRTGKIRDLQDGKTSLSQLKQKILFPSVVKPSSTQQSSINCSAHNCISKATKLLNYKQQASKKFTIPSKGNPASQPLNNRFCSTQMYRNCNQLMHDFKMAELSSCVYYTAPCGNGYVEVSPGSIGMS